MNNAQDSDGRAAVVGLPSGAQDAPAETERLRAVAERLLRNLQHLVADHPDPGAEVLEAIWEARQCVAVPQATGAYSAKDGEPGELFTAVAPFLVRAVQLTDDADWEAIAAWCGGRLVPHEIADSGEYETEMVIPGREGAEGAWPGDWVIKGITGRCFVRGRFEFEATYTYPDGTR